MEEKYCQSCSLPLESQEIYGTNSDGSKNKDYCKHCFENGKFTLECTMEEMIEFCVPYFAANAGISEKETRNKFNELFPKMKRWAKS